MFTVPKRRAVPLTSIQKACQQVSKNRFRRSDRYVPMYNAIASKLQTYNFNSRDFGTMIIKFNSKFVAKTAGSSTILFTDRTNLNIRTVKYIIQIPKDVSYIMKIETSLKILFSISFESLGEYTIMFDDYGIADVFARLKKQNSLIYNKLFRVAKLTIIFGQKEF